MKVLINACNWDVATLFGNYYTKKLTYEYAIQNNHDVFLLDGKEANKKNWEDILKSQNINFTTGCGHGNEYLFTGQNAEPLFSKYDNIQLMEGKYHAWLSCLCGKSGGILDEGVNEYKALAGQGYNRDFAFVVGGETPPDEIAEIFFICHYEFDKHFYEGKSWKECHLLQLKKYDEYLAKDLPPIVAQWLLWDKNGSVIYLLEQTPPPKKKIVLDGYLFSQKIPIHLEGYIAEGE
jgi:hypothetical protein